VGGRFLINFFVNMNYDYLNRINSV
jgi:hypothetical protein